MTKGTFHAGRRAMLAVLGVFAAALAVPALGAADTGIGVPSTSAVKAPPVSNPASTATSTVTQATKAVENAVATATRRTGKAVPSFHVTMTNSKLPGGFSIAALTKHPAKGHVLLVLTRKHGTFHYRVIYGKGVRRLAGNMAQCQMTDDGGTNCVLPLEGEVDNTCTGEAVFIDPDSWFHDKETMSVGTDGTVTLNDQINWQNVKGTADDGTPYSMSDVTKSESTQVPLPLGGVQTTVQRDEIQELISQGSKPNQLLRVSLTTVITFDPTTGTFVFDFQPPQGPGIKCTG